jgi:hypothetical protein
MKQPIFLIALMTLCLTGFSQTLLVEPYIQNADSTSLTISWETDSGTESRVDWSSTALLGLTTTGTTTSGVSTGVVHEVQLSGLTPDTRYFYKVITGTTESDTFSFRTFPSRINNPVIRIVAISDCQYDSNEPTKLSEIINNGIIAYCNSEFGAAPVENNLNLCLLVGDNVNAGYDITQWRNEFFPNIHSLGSSVCLLPVIGNHELNSTNYFAYFNLPQNGPAGYEEHTYFKDISNTRIIGFDSYYLYQTSGQLDWLSSTLALTAADTNIDFVLFQEHYPYHSEMWLAGENDYARQVLDSLEKFNQQCGKPVVFLFGHTHGYSRGQLKESKVLQINTATASGYIDTWGSTPQADYTEFNKSFDEYGFTFIEITSGNTPQMMIKRISRGDASTTLNNFLQDSIMLRRVSMPVSQPECLFPTGGRVVHAECVNLRINPFDAGLGDSVGAVEYQVSQNSNFDNLYFQNWKHLENWYYDNNTQAGDSLSVQPLNNLDPGYMYYWRARYRTQNLDWSPWSNTEFFMTSASSAGNLLYNPGAEDNTNGWNVSTGILESLSAGECAGTSPHSGNYYFGIGGLCVESAYAEAHQDIDISPWSSTIDAGYGIANWGAWMSDYQGSDIPAIRLVFLNSALQAVDSTGWTSSTNTSWTSFTLSDSIPLQTRYIRFSMTGTRNSGTDNDSYIDDMYLYVVDGAIDCNEYIDGLNEIAQPSLFVYPVPANESFNVAVEKNYSGGTVSVFAVSGKLLYQKTNASGLENIDCSSFSKGMYFITLEKENLPTLSGKILTE